MKRYNRRYASFLIGLIICALGMGIVGWSVADAAAQKEASTEQFEEDTVLVGGMPVGIYMETNGVLVLDTQRMTDINGNELEPAQYCIKAGDYITGVNGKVVHNKKELIQNIETLENKHVILTVRRASETLQIKMNAVECERNQYKLGVWVRDNIQGLGTVTFVDQNSGFGALGHGIHDTDTSVLMDITDGRLYKTSIRSIIKGENGSPGSMEGLIVYNHFNQIGTIQKNSEVGIYGIVENIGKLIEDQIPVKVARTEEIEEGDATIRCYVDGNVEEYSVEILEINKYADEINKGITLEVTDSRLLEKTGGIVQGMSGSPILQNGKLVGAVTHVFVNNSAKGYGIFAETMMKEVKKCRM